MICNTRIDGYLIKYFEISSNRQFTDPRMIDKHEKPKARPRFPPAAARNALKS